jgi:hypothetical protein
MIFHKAPQFVARGSSAIAIVSLCLARVSGHIGSLIFEGVPRAEIKKQTQRNMRQQFKASNRIIANMKANQLLEVMRIRGVRVLVH